ncbi:DUF1345 domain-containing protein [Microbacterium sp. W1N]|uniref:DUF1345 domain-containing protein n=1 Tax=Microbacterium festucae TaxID=2977531 RepID=UPI0021C06E9A|nr:DUF1345 domain-containing protein [Microbacterium festucae]MCT9820494.1 DUF1345 domain-containing protein [Microbacterium festucae]
MTVTLRGSGVALRGLCALAAGVVAAVVLTPLLGAAPAVLAGWAVLAAVNVAWVLLVVWPMDAGRTRAHAAREDVARPVARLIALAGSSASLAAVIVMLVLSRDAAPARAFELAGVAVVAVVASWALIQVDYLLHYARMYYGDGPAAGGIDFNQEEPPMYSDFAYFAIGLGLAYQVSDTNVRSGAIRRVVVAQTLLGYLFGAVILAAVVNLVAGLR